MEVFDFIWTLLLYGFAALGYMAVGVWVVAISKARDWKVTFGGDLGDAFLWPVAVVWGPFLAPFFISTFESAKRFLGKP